jgi:hypothetical protein
MLGLDCSCITVIDVVSQRLLLACNRVACAYARCGRRPRLSRDICIPRKKTPSSTRTPFPARRVTALGAMDVLRPLSATSFRSCVRRAQVHTENPRADASPPCPISPVVGPLYALPAPFATWMYARCGNTVGSLRSRSRESGQRSTCHMRYVKYYFSYAPICCVFADMNKASHDTYFQQGQRRFDTYTKTNFCSTFVYV